MKSIASLTLISYILITQSCSASISQNAEDANLMRGLIERKEQAAYDDGGYGDGGGGDYNDGFYEDGTRHPEDVYLFAAGYEHNCGVIREDDKLRCYGSNGSGQLGLGDTLPRGDQSNQMGVNFATTDLGQTSLIFWIALGGFHSCAVFEDFTAKCFGDNRYGQLALGDINNRGDQSNEMGENLPFIQLGNGKDIWTVAAGLFHTCFYLEDKKLACFGNNEYGQLGVGDKVNRGGSISHIGSKISYAGVFVEHFLGIHTGATANHTCISSQDGMSAQCWGSNSKGQLGYGDTKNRGDNKEEMGKRLPKIQLPSSKKVDWVIVGGANTCFLVSGNAYCIGDNQYGQLGLGHTKNVGDNKDEMGSKLKPTAFGDDSSIAHVAIGSNHICFSSSYERAICFGQNAYGQLGQGDKDNRGDSSTTIGENLPNIDIGTYSKQIASIIAGNSHTCIRLRKINYPNDIKCFGNGSKGALGYGDIKNRGDEPNEMGDNLPRVELRYLPPTSSPSNAPTFKPTQKPNEQKTAFPTRKPKTASPTKKPRSG